MLTLVLEIKLICRDKNKKTVHSSDAHINTDIILRIILTLLRLTKLKHGQNISHLEAVKIFSVSHLNEVA